MLFSSLSITGRRKQNEDSFVFCDTAMPFFGIVADGMGGHKGGAVASSLAVQTIERHLKNKNHLSPSEKLEAAINAANTAVFSHASQHSEVNNMGTTVVCALLNADKITYAHVGDSRIYLLHEGVLKRLTDDHSYVWTLVKDGILDEEGARTHKMRNIITRAVGLHETVNSCVDEVDWVAGDLLLLCSDGLHDEMPHYQIQSIMSEDKPLDDIAKQLVDTAYNNGSEDNITVLLIRNTPEA